MIRLAQEVAIYVCWFVVDVIFIHDVDVTAYVRVTRSCDAQIERSAVFPDDPIVLQVLLQGYAIGPRIA